MSPAPLVFFSTTTAWGTQGLAFQRCPVQPHGDAPTDRRVKEREVDPEVGAQDPLAVHLVVASLAAVVGRRRLGLVPTGLPVDRIEVSARVQVLLEQAGRLRRVAFDAPRVRRVGGVQVRLDRETAEDRGRVGQLTMRRVAPPISGPLVVMGDVMTLSVVTVRQMGQAGRARGVVRVALAPNAMMIVAIDREMAHRRCAKIAHRVSRELRPSVVRRKCEPEVVVGRGSIRRRQRPNEPLNVGSTRARCGLRPRLPCNEHSRSVVAESWILRLPSASLRPFHRRSVQRVFVNA